MPLKKIGFVSLLCASLAAGSSSAGGVALPVGGGASNGGAIIAIGLLAAITFIILGEKAITADNSEKSTE